jgi:hypothetical protein
LVSGTLAVFEKLQLMMFSGTVNPFRSFLLRRHGSIVFQSISPPDGSNSTYREFLLLVEAEALGVYPVW